MVLFSLDIIPELKIWDAQRIAQIILNPTDKFIDQVILNQINYTEFNIRKAKINGYDVVDFYNGKKLINTVMCCKVSILETKA